MPDTPADDHPQTSARRSEGSEPDGTKEPNILGLKPKPMLLFLIAVGIIIFATGNVWWAFGSTSGNALFSTPVAYRIGVVVALTMFLPFTAVSFYAVRREVRRKQLHEESRTLGIDFEHYYRVYKRETLDSHFLYAVCFTAAITLFGLTAVFLGREFGLSTSENLLLRGTYSSDNPKTLEAYQTQTLLFFGMAFLGAYLWGLQHILHRYNTSDLTPSVYYGLSSRMIFAAIVALLIYHMLPDIAEPISSGGASASGDAGDSAGNANGGTRIASSFLPALAFVIGIFPQRALQYLTDRMSTVLAPSTPRAREIPLELIQGVSVNDRMRLAEEGIESCFDLANAEFVQLLFTTPYQPLQLIDWQLQARLVLYFGNAAEELREQGVRTISDLKRIKDGNALVEKTSATRSAVDLARARAEEDKSIEFLESLRNKVLSGQTMKTIEVKKQDSRGAGEPGTDGPSAGGDGKEQLVIERRMQSRPPPDASPNGGT